MNNISRVATAAVVTAAAAAGTVVAAPVAGAAPYHDPACNGHTDIYSGWMATGNAANPEVLGTTSSNCWTRGYRNGVLVVDRLRSQSGELVGQFCDNCDGWSTKPT